jgi:hypothetical protein
MNIAIIIVSRLDFTLTKLNALLITERKKDFAKKDQYAVKPLRHNQLTQQTK